MLTHLTVQHGYYFSGKVIGLSVFAVTKTKMSNSLPMAVSIVTMGSQV